MKRILIVHRVSQYLRRSDPVDVYALVTSLRLEFPNTAEADIRRIVDEEVVAARVNALWEPRGSQ